MTDQPIIVIGSYLEPDLVARIRAAQLALLPPHAVVVNIARGQVVDSGALDDALANGRLGGACLNVFNPEPLPADSPLWSLDNVLVPPHSASTVATENERLAAMIREWRSPPATRRTSRSPGIPWRPASTCCARSRCTAPPRRPPAPPRSPEGLTEAAALGRLNVGR